MASKSALMPASRIHAMTFSPASRCCGVRKLRVSRPGSSETAASASAQPMIVGPSGSDSRSESAISSFRINTQELRQAELGDPRDLVERAGEFLFRRMPEALFEDRED